MHCATARTNTFQLAVGLHWGCYRFNTVWQHFGYALYMQNHSVLQKKFHRIRLLRPSGTAAANGYEQGWGLHARLVFPPNHDTIYINGTRVGCS